MRSKSLSLIVALALLVGVLVFATTSGYSQEAPRSGDVTRGTEVYAANCANCHGAQGEGNLGIPNIAGVAERLEHFGLPPEPGVLAAGTMEMLRDGIPGKMPVFPPEIMSDEDVMDLFAFALTVPPTTGDNVYKASCALCHGAAGQGGLAVPLAGAAEEFAAMGVPKEAIAEGFPDLVREGIPGVMPGLPQLTDVEIERLFEYLWALDSWEARFEDTHGRAPTAQDRSDREWSLQFLSETGRAPTQEDWERHWLEIQRRSLPGSLVLLHDASEILSSACSSISFCAFSGAA